jgi:hypothetical protein
VTSLLVLAILSGTSGLGKIASGVNQPKMRKRLREIADEAFRVRVILFPEGGMTGIASG